MLGSEAPTYTFVHLINRYLSVSSIKISFLRAKFSEKDNLSACTPILYFLLLSFYTFVYLSGHSNFIWWRRWGGGRYLFKNCLKEIITLIGKREENGSYKDIWLSLTLLPIELDNWDIFG